MLNFKLDMIDEKREVAVTRIASYKQQAARYYNNNIQTRTYRVGNWVIRKVFQNTKEADARILGPN